MNKEHPWWNPDTSWPGVVLMAASGFVTAYSLMYYFGLDYLLASFIASGVAVLVGLLWNLIAHIRGTKKIHWLDFVWVDLFPW